MKTIRHYFDKNGKQTTKESAVEVHEVTLNDSGKVVNDSIYKVETKTAKPAPGK